MSLFERELSGALQGVSIEPPLGADVGIVLLGGSSGSIPVERARLLASSGCRVLALRWFGGEGQSPGICEIPLEYVQGAVDELVRRDCRRIIVMGASKGAEAALLLATVDERIDLTVAFSPTSVVWGNVGPGMDGFEWPQRSSFSWNGLGLCFVPHRAEALLSLNRLPPIRYLEFFERSLEEFDDAVAAAAIPVERIVGKTILVAGGDDHLWPSLRFAQAMVRRGADHGRDIYLLSHPDAGHRILLPGETTPPSRLNVHGGGDIPDAELGEHAWAALKEWISR